MALPTVVWTLPHNSLIKNMVYRLAYKPCEGGIFSTDGPFDQMAIACVKLTKKPTQYNVYNIYYYLPCVYF